MKINDDFFTPIAVLAMMALSFLGGAALMLFIITYNCGNCLW